MKTKLLILMLVGALAAVSSWAQVVAPLHVGTTNGLVDEFGVQLPGTDPAADQYGQPVVVGDLVQFLLADTNGVVSAPATNGTPHPSNQLIASTRIGRGVDPSLGASGKFGASLTALNRAGGSPIKLVARVFNAPELDQASFYVDSEVYNVPVFGASKYDVFIPQFTTAATTQLLDSTDYDGDGLKRSWEISYGADPENPDSDGDGMADGPEIRAGTGVTDPESLLQMVWLTPQPPYDMGLSWDSVTGKTYQVQFTTNDLAQEPIFEDINGAVLATGTVSATIVTNGLLLPAAHYRVRLVE